jgi:endonuclease/exonuclease/phosphatase family metal-dependent hydrolase
MQEDQTMKVMSFNVRSDASGKITWPMRRDGVAAVLQNHQPDLAGLQEPTANMVHDLHERLPDYRWVGLGRDDGREAGEFTPIFFRTDRWELQEHASFWLAAICDLPGKGWDALCCRIVTWARFVDRTTGEPCVHFNTHLDHLGRNARSQSALLLLQKIHEIAGHDPVVLTGDFNCRETSTPYCILTGKVPPSRVPAHYGHLRDCYYDSSAPPAGPKKTYRGLLRFIGIGRIDYAFVKNDFKTQSYRVLDEGRGASDHRPLVVELAHGVERSKEPHAMHADPYSKSRP